MQPRRPRVLLAGLAPLAAVGMRKSLAAHEVEFVGREDQEDRPLAVEAMARSLIPDVVVLSLESRGIETLCARIRRATPDTTVILWAAEEDRLRIIGPGARSIREVQPGGVAELRRELLASQSEHVKE
jgi:DNA-binding NarL/FixJ family response regulator